MTTEASIAKRLIAAALGRGYLLSVSDGEETVVRKSDDARAIFNAMQSTGEDYLTLYKDGVRRGSFWLVWGNDPSGDELIADHTANEECEQLYRLIFPY